MKTRRRVFLYGNSIILGTMADSLRRFPQFEVTTLAPPLQQLQEIDAAKPDVLLFDLEAADTKAVFSFLENNPNLVLVGLSPGVNVVKVWSGRQFRELSVRGLLEVICHEIDGLQAEPAPRGLA